MSENIKALSSTAILIACLGLIAFLVHMKVDGATTLAVSSAAIIIAFFTKSPDGKGPPAGTAVFVAIATAASGLLISGCSLFTPDNVKTALDATQLACVFASELTDAPAVATACKVDQALVPVIEKLIAEREGAKKAGVKWAGQ